MTDLDDREALAAALYNLNPCGEQPTDADGRPLGPGGAIPWTAMDEYDPKAAQQVRWQAQAIADLEQSDWSALEDDISDAINDSLDMDWTSRDGARAVVRALNELRCPPPQIPGWQLIETAPRDGTDVLLYAGYKGQAVGAWDDFEAEWITDHRGKGDWQAVKATHWRQLSAPPTD